MDIERLWWEENSGFVGKVGGCIRRCFRDCKAVDLVHARTTSYGIDLSVGRRWFGPFDILLA